MVLAHSKLEQNLGGETGPDQSHHYLLQLTLQSAGESCDWLCGLKIASAKFFIP